MPSTSDPPANAPVEANPSTGGEPADPQEAAEAPAAAAGPGGEGRGRGEGGAATPAAAGAAPSAAEAQAPAVEAAGEGGGSSEDDDDDERSRSHSEHSHSDDEHSDEEPDMLDVLPPAVALRVEALRSLHAEREDLMEKYKLERAELERRYADLCRPLYDRRREIVAGERDGEIADAAKAEEEEADKEKDEGEGEGEGEAAAQAAEGGGDDEEEEEEPVKGVPQFWVCAMGHMDAVAELIAERDVDCLEHLTDVTCEDRDDGEGFTLRFHFSPNPYFHNDVLTKRYEIPNLLLEDEPILKDVVGCDVRWKDPGRSLTYREVRKKQRAKGGKRAGRVRTVTKRERTDSFFHFFSPPKLPSMEEMDEEQAERIEHAFDVDYDVAQAFRSHIIPKAVAWFTGEAMDEGMEGMVDEEGMPLQGEGDGDNDNDDDAPSGGGAGGGAGGGTSSPFPAPAAGGGENPECQQS